MATMKAFTDINQSRKLVEILPPESADMWWREVSYGFYHIEAEIPKGWYDEPPKGIPCWSLAALFNIIPKHIKQNDGRTYRFRIFNDDGIVIQRWGCSYVAEDYHNRAEYLSDPNLKYPTNIYSGKYEDILDACVEMILKLNEQKLL